MTMLPIVLFWCLALWGLTSRKPVLIYLFFGTMSVGAFAAVPTALTGGLTFTATPIVALMLILRTFVNRSGPSTVLAYGVMPQRLMLLFLFWLVAAVTTMFMPRLFAGDALVVPVRGVLSATAPLRPTAQNLSQFAYVTISVFTVFAFAKVMQAPVMRQHALQAMCLGGFVTAATGFLDFTSQYLPLSPLLEPFRTASYALATSVEVLGSKRVVGLMPEASAYGSHCLAFLCSIYFYRRAIVSNRVRNVYAPMVLGLLLVCAWLAKSSGTYVGVAIFIAVAAAEWLLRANVTEQRGAIYRRGLGGEMTVVVSIIIACLVLVIVTPQVLDAVFALIDRMVLQKGESDSFAQRGMWRSVALASLFDTYGFGVGLGSTRASSSLVAIASSTGLIGAMLFYGFLLQSLLRPTQGTPPETQLVISAFRFSFIPVFAVSLMTGDADFGGMVAFGFGITTALTIVAVRERDWFAGRRQFSFG